MFFMAAKNINDHVKQREAIHRHVARMAIAHHVKESAHHRIIISHLKILILQIILQKKAFLYVPVVL